MIEFQMDYRVPKKFTNDMWAFFMKGYRHVSPSGLTAAVVAARAQQEDIGYVLVYDPEESCYTIEKYRP